MAFMHPRNPAPAQNHNIDKLLQEFKTRLMNDYKINLSDSDPISCQVVLLEIAIKNLKTQLDQLVMHYAENMNELSLKWKDREEEFLQTYFQQIDDWQKDLKIMVNANFLDAIKELHEDLMKHQHEYLNKELQYHTKTFLTRLYIGASVLCFGAIGLGFAIGHFMI